VLERTHPRRPSLAPRLRRPPPDRESQAPPRPARTPQVRSQTPRRPSRSPRVAPSTRGAHLRSHRFRRKTRGTHRGLRGSLPETTTPAWNPRGQLQKPPVWLPDPGTAQCNRRRPRRVSRAMAWGSPQSWQAGAKAPEGPQNVARGQSDEGAATPGWRDGTISKPQRGGRRCNGEWIFCRPYRGWGKIGTSSPGAAAPSSLCPRATSFRLSEAISAPCTALFRSFPYIGSKPYS